MRLILLIFINALFLFPCNIASQEIKANDVTLIASPKDKDVCVIKIDKDYFLAHVSDVRLINPLAMESIELFLPDSDYFKCVKKEQPVLFENIQAVFVIEKKKGKKLPNKFTK